MRIVQLLGNMDAGGAERVALRLADDLRARGHEVEVWFLYVRRPTFMGLPGVRVVLPRRARARDVPGIVRATWRMLRAYRPDAVISHMPLSGVLLHLLSLSLRVPRRVAVQHNPASSYGAAGRLGDAIIGSVGVYTRNVAVSHAVEDSFRGYPRGYRRRVEVVHNGLPAPARPEPGRAELRAGVGLPVDGPLLVNIGRLEPQKNQEAIVRALPLLPGARLAIAGAGALHGELAALAERLGVADRLHLLGEIPRERVPELICAGDVFVFPSRFEGLPLALIEVMHLGVPIVASDIPSIRELTAEAAVLVPDPAPGPLAAAIGSLLDDPERAAAVAEAAVRRAQLFSVDAMAERYAAIIEGS